MKKTLIFTVLFSLLLTATACNKMGNTYDETPLKAYEIVNDNFLEYSQSDFRFSYPELFNVLKIEDTIKVDSGGDNFLLLITPSQNPIENPEEGDPTEQLHAGRETYGYELLLYYNNQEEREELMKVVDTVEVLQSYRNGAHSFKVYFPQDWYFNFENNDRNCLNTFEAGAIKSNEDCENAAINIYISKTMDDAILKAEEIVNSKEGTYDPSEPSILVGKREVKLLPYTAEDKEMLILFFDHGKNSLVFDLSDLSLRDDLEKIIKYLE